MGEVNLHSMVRVPEPDGTSEKVVAWMDDKSVWFGARAPATTGLKALVLADDYARLEAELARVREDARRWQYAKSRARKNDAYDVYGNGALWTIAIHTEDSRLTIDAATDAALAGGEAE